MTEGRGGMDEVAPEIRTADIGNHHLHFSRQLCRRARERPVEGRQNKINAAFAFGGAPLAAQAVNELTGVPLDGAMIADFAGIRDMVDAVGGVSVRIPCNVKSYFSSLSTAAPSAPR